jgi:hypothetical protein
VIVTRANDAGLSFLSLRLPALIRRAFSLEPAHGNTVQPALLGRLGAAFNEGLLAKGLGGPVDLMNGILPYAGVPTSETPFLGSAMISNGMHRLGIGRVDQSYAPRSRAERYGQQAAQRAA